MRVLFWSYVFWPDIGGIEVVTAQLLPALMERGHEFMVVAQGSSDSLSEADFHGIPIHRFPFDAALLRRDMSELGAILKSIADLKRAFKPDLIHLNTSGPDAFFHLHTKDSVPSVDLFTVHFLPPTMLDANSLLGRCLKSSDWVAAVSQAMLYDARGIVPEIGNRSSLIYNGLPMPPLRPAPLQFDGPRILCLGRVVPEKGFDIALDALPAVLDCSPDARLLVAGNGRAMPRLKTQAARLGVQDCVEFVGWVDPEQVPELINTATVVAMPSRWREPFGLVALQAAQMARPVVAARVGGIPEIVIHQQTGLLFEPENSTALAEQIVFLLRNPAEATRMGWTARRRAQNVFGLEQLVDSYDALYHRLLGTA